MSLRRAVVALVALVLVAGAGYTAYWFHVADTLCKQIDAWAEARRAAGWQAEWSSLAVTGFPNRVTAHMGAPRLTSPAGLEWTTAAVTASASPLDITLITVTAPGSHILRWPGGGEAAVTAGAASAEIDLGPTGRLDDASLLLGDVMATARGETLSLASLAVGIDPAPVPAGGHEDVSVAFSLSAQDIRLPALTGLVLDREVALVEASGRVMGAIPPGPPLEALAAWSADGGTVELDRVVIDWAPMALEADGTLALDAGMQPLVALSARVRGYGQLMDRLARARVVDPGAAAAAKMVLSLLAKPDSQGRPAIPLPVTVQDGALYLGPARVGTVPPLAWPDQRPGQRPGQR